MKFFTDPKVVIFPPAVALLFFGLSLGACSGSTATNCDTDDDCFTDEICVGGYCEISNGNGDGDGGDNGNGDNGNGDSGTGDNGDGDNGEGDNGEGDNGEGDNGNGACSHSGFCDSGVEELEDDGLYTISPEDEDESSFFGCNLSPDGSWFAGGVVKTPEVDACPEREHYFRIPTRECRDRDFVLEVELEPLDDQCLVDDHAEVDFGVTSSPLECDWDDGPTTTCHEKEQLDHGGWRWKAYFEKVDNPGSQSELWPGLSVEAHRGSTFPYQVTVTVDE